MKAYPLAKVKTLSGASVHGGEEFSSQTSFPKHDLLTKDTLHNETSNTAIQRAGGMQHSMWHTAGTFSKGQGGPPLCTAYLRPPPRHSILDWP